MFSSSSAPLSQASETASAVLHYIPHCSLYQNVGEVGDSPSIPAETHWNEEAIGDFVRKLGFLDAEGRVEYDINHFLHINQVLCVLCVHVCVCACVCVHICMPVRMHT